MSFVDIHGNPLQIGDRYSHIPKKRVVAKDEREKKHLGFAVTGYSPEMMSEAAADHQAAVSRGEIEGEFSADTFMNGHKPRKARSAPYSMSDSAAQCAEMLRKAGWLRVTVSEVIR